MMQVDDNIQKVFFTLLKLDLLDVKSKCFSHITSVFLTFFSIKY